MKRLHKLLLACLLLVNVTSCEHYIEGDGINRNLNNPTAVPITSQLPAFQIAMADITGGNFSMFNCLLVQQVEGANRCATLNSYTGLTPNRYNVAWTNIYEKILNEIHLARRTAIEDGYKHYQGILNIMEAYTLMMATDVWDDMPYSEALQGMGSMHPNFNTQASIYVAIYALLDEGLVFFAGAAGPLSVSSDDVFYSGNIDNWILAAHAIRARGLLKDKNYAGARSEAMLSFDDASQNMAFQYPDANAAGPWYRFNDARTGDVEFHPTMRRLMTDLNDMDRLNVMDGTFTISHPYLKADFLQEMLTFREMQFIIAEADIRAGGTQVGYDAYLAGIKASFARLGLGNAEYDAYIAQAGIAPGIGNLTLEDVMTQKYIAMYLQPEVYNDWRRTGIPALTPVFGSAIPVRWNYALNEYLFNANAPAETAIDIYTDKVGWNR